MGRTHAEHPAVVHLEDPGLQTDRPSSLGGGAGRAGRGAGGPGNGDTLSCHGEEAPGPLGYGVPNDCHPLLQHILSNLDYVGKI